MAHNLVYFDSSTNTIQKFSNAQLDDLAERVLRVMASGTYTGSISVGTSNPIGTFADTALVGAAGGTNTSVVTNTYTLSQVSTATLSASSNPPMHVGLDTTSPTQTVLQENLTTKEQLADEILSRMVASTGGTNAYYLASSAPADGATWVSRGTLLDTITNNTVTVTDYKLWQRTTSGATITNRDPVKLSSGNIQSFSTAEINALIKTIEERIIATGIGTYVLQASAPATGTWTNVGTVTDTREDIATSSFTGVGSYTNEDASAYTSTYLGTIAYTGDDAIAYAGSYVGTRSFINPDGVAFQATYLGPDTYFSPATTVNPDGASFTNVNSPQSAFSGPNYNRSYTNDFFGSYIGNNATPFTQGYIGGPFPFSPGFSPTPQGMPPGPFFGTRTFTATYLGPATFDGPTYNNNFNSPVGFSTTYLGPDTYLGPTLIPTFASFTNVNSPQSSFSSPSYSGPTGPFVSPFTSFDTTYLGPATFLSADTGFDGSNYSGPQSYEGTAGYQGTRVDSTTSTISTRTLWRRVA
jgi:hypothetical protein